MCMNNFKTYHFFFLFAACVATSCSTIKKSHESAKHTVISSENKNKANSSTHLKTKYSALLYVDEQKIDNLPLYALIDDWYGTSYKYGGCDKNGIDCSNFVGILYQQIYNTSLKGSSASIFNQCMVIKKNDLKEGDLVFFKIESDRISHVGIYLQNNKFVHATTKKGVMINDLNEPYYTTHFYIAGRLK